MSCRELQRSVAAEPLSKPRARKKRSKRSSSGQGPINRTPSPTRRRRLTRKFPHDAACNPTASSSNLAAPTTKTCRGWRKRRRGQRYAPIALRRPTNANIGLLCANGEEPTIRANEPISHGHSHTLKHFTIDNFKIFAVCNLCHLQVMNVLFISTFIQ